jgi:hypothetical protein
VADERESAKPNLALIGLAFVFCWPLALWMMWHHKLGSRGERIGPYTLFLLGTSTK